MAKTLAETQKLMKKKLLITGGAGFIGSNLADYFSGKNYQVTVFDNFGRFGTRENAQWLKTNHPEIKFIKGDIRKSKDLNRAVKNMDIIFHLAAQVAVTTSISDPQTDFDINALGTFNLLEAVRKIGSSPILIYTSTNKVYGGMDNLAIVEKNNQYVYRDLKKGVDETRNLDFHSPYGCSKGAADQYVRDYERIYDIPTVVLRQSCIYGPRQFGIEDQGWVAWFIIALSLDKSITVYGDGKQVRDVLYISDLVSLFEIVINKINTSRGKVYNVGGGINNTLAVWTKFGPMLEKLFTRKINVKFDDWRPGDQKVFVSDIKLAEKELGWKPKIGVDEGVKKLYAWVQQNKSLFAK